MLLPLALSGLLSGCYSYRVAPPGSLAAGADVRLRLTDDGATALTADAGLRLHMLEGTLQSIRTDGSLIVLPTSVTTVDGDALPWRRGALTVPAQAVDGTERRTVSRRRSVAVAVGITTVFAAVVTFALRSIRSGSGGSVSPGPGTPE